MKRFMTIMALVLLASGPAHASIVQETATLNSFIGGGGSASYTQQFVVTDGSDSATIDVTISTPSGTWANLGDYAINSGTGSHDANWIFGAEAPTITAHLVSSTATATGFNVESLGIWAINNGGSPPGLIAQWDSSVTSGLSVSGLVDPAADVALDTPTSFHLISSSDYVGTLTDISPGDGANIYRLDTDETNNLVFNVEFGGAPPVVVPEPAGLGLVGLALLGVRRRRS